MSTAVRLEEGEQGSAATPPDDPGRRGVAAVAAEWFAPAARPGRSELAALAAIFALGALLRFVNLPLRGGWDSDQGTEMLALRNAVASGRLPLFGPGAISVASPFHHGALYYDLLLPAAWLGNGDPVWVVAEIALLSLIVIPAVWWIGRSIAGAWAGIIAALLAAVSASLIGYATFIWNPTLVEPAAAAAWLGAWQALRTGRGPWWLLCAGGAAIAMQSHVAAAVIVAPLSVAFLVAVVREPRSRRGRTLAWGLAGALLIVATYLPVIMYELTHDFAETRAMLAYFTSPDTAPARDPILRLVFSGIRILAWPLTRWPLVDRDPGFGFAFLVAAGLLLGLVWRVTGSRIVRTAGPTSREAVLFDAAASEVDANRPGVESLGTDRPGVESLGTALVAGWLLLVTVLLGLGLRAVSEVQGLPTEQYHVVADPLVFVAAGLVVAALLRPLPRKFWTVARRAAAVGTVVVLIAWNVPRWPPLESPDGGWLAAQAAASRVERDAAGSPLALVPLYEPKGSDAYAYPLLRDGAGLTSEATASTIVVLCDSFWLKGCGGDAEAAWQAADPARSRLLLVDRFAAAPDRTLSVYRRTP